MVFFQNLFMVLINDSLLLHWPAPSHWHLRNTPPFLLWNICSHANQGAQHYFFKINMPMDTPQRSIPVTQTLSSWHLPWVRFVVPVARYKKRGQNQASTSPTKKNKDPFAIAFNIQHLEITLFSTAHFTGIFYWLKSVSSLFWVSCCKPSANALWWADDSDYHLHWWTSCEYRHSQNDFRGGCNRKNCLKRFQCNSIDTGCLWK